MATSTPREGSLSPKEVVRRFCEEVVNRGNNRVLDELSTRTSNSPAAWPAPRPVGRV